MLFDYAKIRTVVEDRRSVIGALLAAGRFVRRRPGATLGLYLLTGLLFVAVLAVYAIAAPGAEGGGAWVWADARHRPGVHRRAAGAEAGLLRGANRVLPGPARARRLRRGPAARLARLAGRGGDHRFRPARRLLSVRSRRSASVRITLMRANGLSLASTSTQGARRVLVRATISLTASS